MKLDNLSDLAKRALFHILDRIEAETSANRARFSARNVGRAVAAQLGMTTWKGQSVAKVWCATSRRGRR